MLGMMVSVRAEGFCSMSRRPRTWSETAYCEVFLLLIFHRRRLGNDGTNGKSKVLLMSPDALENDYAEASIDSRLSVFLSRVAKV